jgi:hypothetical protein
VAVTSCELSTVDFRLRTSSFLNICILAARHPRLSHLHDTRDQTPFYAPTPRYANLRYATVARVRLTCAFFFHLHLLCIVVENGAGMPP